MAQNDLFKRYLDAGMAFTQMTRDRAEALVKDWVKNGEVQREQAQEWVEDLLERSRKNTEAVVELIRTEIRQQLKANGFGPRRRSSGTASATAKTATAATTKKSAGAAKAAAKKSAGAAKKAAAKKAAPVAKKTATAKAGAAKRAKKA